MPVFMENVKDKTVKFLDWFPPSEIDHVVDLFKIYGFEDEDGIEYSFVSAKLGKGESDLELWIDAKPSN